MLAGCGRLHFDDVALGDAGDGEGGTDGGMTVTCDRGIPSTPTYFVDTNTGADANPGTQQAPTKTIARALTLSASTGGTIVVGRGNYSETLDISTTVPLTLFSEERYAARVTRFNCSGCSNLTIDGFEITGATVPLVSITAGVHVVLRDNVVFGGSSAGIRVTSGSDDITIKSNVIYDTFASQIHVNDASNVTIRDNVVFYDQGSTTGIGKIWLEASTDARIIGNVVFRATGNDNSYGMISLRATTGTTFVENNVVGGSPGATDVYAPIGFDMATGTAIIRHNTFVGPQPGTAFGVGAGALFSGNYQLVNNLWASAGTAQPFTDGTPPAGALTLRHNLYWNNGGAFAAGGAPSPANDAEAVAGNPGVAFTVPAPPSRTPTGFAGGATTSCEVHDQLVEAMAKIPSTSPAVGAADPTNSPGQDARGHARPTPAALGAYQP